MREVAKTPCELVDKESFVLFLVVIRRHPLPQTHYHNNGQYFSVPPIAYWVLEVDNLHFSQPRTFHFRILSSPSTRNIRSERHPPQPAIARNEGVRVRGLRCIRG